MNRHSIVVAGLSAVVALGLLTACGTNPGSDEEHVLRLAVPAGPEGNFSSGVAYATFTGEVYESLFRLTLPDKEFEPWLATGYEWNDDRTVMTITLRDDVDFTDGTHFDAEAVKANIDFHRSGTQPSAPYFAAIDEVVVTDEYTLEVRLSRPDSELISFMGVVKAMVSPALLTNPEEALPTEPIGTGPYVLGSSTVDVSYTFVRNPDYWNPEAFPFDEVEFVVMEDVTARINALKSGQVDAAPVDVSSAGEAEASGFTVFEGSGENWVGLILGDRRGEIVPALGDVRVRHAIMMALDREGYREIRGYGDSSNQIGVPGEPGYYLEDRADDYAFDLEAAKELMAEAGYADGFDIKIPYLAGFTGQYQPYFEQAFADLGIRVEWVVLTDDNVATEYFGGKYAILPVSAWAPDLGFVKADGVWNPWHNTDEEVDELLVGITTGDDEERLESLSALTEKILDEGWYAILGHEPTLTAYDGDLIEIGPHARSGLQLIDFELKS